MKKYECLYIVNINFDSEGISAVVARVEDVLKRVGGELVNTQHWGKRKLAYAINKERYGNYVLMHFQGENPDISELAREFEIESGVLHYMTIRLKEFPDFETLTVPQAFESDRGRRPGGRDSRDNKPRRYERETAEKTSDEAVEGETKVAVEATEENVETAKVIEETPVEATEETTEAAEVAEASVTSEAEVEESAAETTEEEAEKPADAE